MTLILEPGLREPAKGSGTRITKPLVSHWKRLRRKFAIRRTRRVLEDLPDWILRDVGTFRGDILS